MTGTATPTTVEAALDWQERMRHRVRVTEERVEPLHVTGVDVAYDDDAGEAVAAAVTVELATLRPVERVTRRVAVDFPYLPGLLAFRESPPLLAAVRALSRPPELIVCDGHGLAHPRRFGLACHIGVTLDVPTIGVAKNPPMFDVDQPGPDRGDWTPLETDGEVLGRGLRTQRNVKPVYVSIGHAVGLDEATDLVLRLSPRYRQPETTRLADQLCRRALADTRG
ncbi:endonuclease V [Stackebrandtia soli]|uniref:endonuclease V n=1 Tax=Stackebrandtia soli TaxID=1892856 RepID=UPI0039ED05FA